MVVAGAFSFSFFPEGCGLAVYVSGESIVPTSALVDGFREEPETGSAPVFVSSLRLPQQAPSLEWV
ncbi:hypothetical protein CSV65_15395 [Sporosarcina sp. P31]|nr:hypothetical protein CSV66_15325 [Sporosarcina sp. P30]PID07555.1 hypothetical protein CSV65_15395 [Sporosarcina sp. P31]PID10762.1 hypothetical protein CSV64_15330 [Sporosarcina sp. P32b]